MLLLRGATHQRGNHQRRVSVSIHAPLARSNFESGLRFAGSTVSIHAPLARSNNTDADVLQDWWFQYMLLLRGATRERHHDDCRAGVSIHAPLARSNQEVVRDAPEQEVSIHAPLARSNQKRSELDPKTSCFNTCSSCEEQLLRDIFLTIMSLCQYMLLLRGATTCSAMLLR